MTSPIRGLRVGECVSTVLRGPKSDLTTRSRKERRWRFPGPSRARRALSCSPPPWPSRPAAPPSSRPIHPRPRTRVPPRPAGSRPRSRRASVRAAWPTRSSRMPRPASVPMPPPMPWPSSRPASRATSCPGRDLLPGNLAKTMLAVQVAGGDVDSFGGHDLEADLRSLLITTPGPDLGRFGTAPELRSGVRHHRAVPHERRGPGRVGRLARGRPVLQRRLPVGRVLPRRRRRGSRHDRPRPPGAARRRAPRALRRPRPTSCSTSRARTARSARSGRRTRTAPASPGQALRAAGKSRRGQRRGRLDPDPPVRLRRAGRGSWRLPVGDLECRVPGVLDPAGRPRPRRTEPGRPQHRRGLGRGARPRVRCRRAVRRPVE